MRWIGLLLLVLVAQRGFAGGPVNDFWEMRTPIPVASLNAGFSDSITNVASATTTGTDPLLVCKNGDPQQRGNTLWYGLNLSAEQQPVFVNIGADGYDNIISVFTGDPKSGFSPVVGGCNDDGGTSFSARLDGVRLDPGQNYSIMVSRPSQNSNVATLGFLIRLSPRYQVTKTEDTQDGSCNADCSLREAISAANAQAGAVLIPAGTYTLTLTAANGENNNATGDLDVRTGMGIHGAGAGQTLIRGIQPGGGTRERVFDIEPANAAALGITANFTDLTIRDGSSTGRGGGINSDGFAVGDHLALNRVEVRSNASTINTGGGVHSSGPTVVANTTIADNTANSDGGGLALNGTVITRTDVFNSTFSGNTSNSDFAAGGGGIRSTTDLYVYNSTFSGNQARHSGGGILSTTANGKLTLLNVTFAGNVADSNDNGGALGGGVRAEGLSALVRNVVFSGNLNNAGAATATIADDCQANATVTGSGNTSFFANHLEVLAANTSCPTADASNVHGVLASLEPLTLNGGTTASHRPAPGSPVVDSGSVADCLGRDQRGVFRPQDGNNDTVAVCDKGAIELSPTDVDALFQNGFE